MDNFNKMFECDECDRKFTTKQGKNMHKTKTHTKQKDEAMKRARSLHEKTNLSDFQCDKCTYSARSKWALKAHVNHKHKEPTSPNEKKPRIGTEVVENILLEVVENITMEDERMKKSKTAIEPTKDFLTNTAVTLAEMLDSIADQIDENQEDEDDDMTELEDRLDILRGDQPRNQRMVVDDDSENTLVTLPLKDVEELRLKLRNLEEINEELTHAIKGVEEMKIKLKDLEETNKELVHKVKETQGKKSSKKNRGTRREEFIVIDMDINEEDDGIEELLRNKVIGFVRPNPQNPAERKMGQKSFDCPGCEMKFKNREHMASHQKTHEINCTMCERAFSSNYKLQEHMRTEHDEMICHSQCGGGRCIIEETGSQQLGITCNFCGEVFPSKIHC